MSKEDSFVNYLYGLKHEDKGTLASLRRACGHRLAESKDCQAFASVSTRPTDFLTVTLAAQYSSAKITKGEHHLAYKNKGSLGAAWARYCRERDESQDPTKFYRGQQEALAAGQSPARPPNIHERFRTLLDAEIELDGTGELAYRLRGLVRMLVAANVPIDIIQLAHDLRGWRAESRYVQERWAKAFYAPTYEKDSAEQSSDESNDPDSERDSEENENVD